jgi:mannose-1-phosphate guanylyltransferase
MDAEMLENLHADHSDVSAFENKDQEKLDPMKALAIGRDELDTAGPGPGNSGGGGDLSANRHFPVELVPHRDRWGIVLAGGDGVRLRSLVKAICGEERPKQFCPLVEGRTLLAQTLRRTELTIPRDQVLVSVAGYHSEWYMREAGLLPDQLIIQPSNRGTAPAVLHSAMSIAQIDPNALVAVLPSDHHYSNESLFVAALESAFETAAECPDAVVLLGARADHPETEYGWIELGDSVRQQDLFSVRAFREKPSHETARDLWLNQGSVWNTFVMVGRVGAFLEMFQDALPKLATDLAAAAPWKGRQTNIESSLYAQLPSIDFSKQVLSTQTKRLLVLRLGDVGWCDLGGPERVLAMFPPDSPPPWMAQWQRTSDPEVIS